MPSIVYGCNVGASNYAIYSSGEKFTLALESGAWPENGAYSIIQARLFIGKMAVENHNRKLLVRARADVDNYYIINNVMSDLGYGTEGTFYDQYLACGTGFDYKALRHSVSPDTYYIGLYSAQGNASAAGPVINIRSGSDIKLIIDYELTTTPCTAPTWVSLDKALTENTATLSWGGASGGTGNAISGYGVQYRDSADGSSWGGWYDYNTATGNSLVVAANGSRGYYRQFRVQTRGAAGSTYDSGYTQCGTSLRKNSAPSVPTVTNPLAGAQVYCGNLYIKATLAADQDGQAQQLQVKIDSGSWANYGTAAAGARTVRGRLGTTLASGVHTVAFRVVDALGAASGEVSRSITVRAASWARTLATGTTLANTSVSHRTDINELLTAINRVRAAYGMAAATLPGTVGAFVSWKGQMQALQAALGDCYTAAGETVPTWESVPGYPKASVVNQLREKVAGV